MPSKPQDGEARALVTNLVIEARDRRVRCGAANLQFRAGAPKLFCWVGIVWVMAGLLQDIAFAAE